MKCGPRFSHSSTSYRLIQNETLGVKLRKMLGSSRVLKTRLGPAKRPPIKVPEPSVSDPMSPLRVPAHRQSIECSRIYFFIASPFLTIGGLPLPNGSGLREHMQS